MPKIGFMQGRLSPLVDGKIQAFPRDHWRQEFSLAARLGFDLMEWTLDQAGLRENPLMTEEGRREIRDLSHRHGVAVLSVTGDCLMQAPFFKASGSASEHLLDELRVILNAMIELGIRYLVMPLVDNGHVANAAEAERLNAGLAKVEPVLRRDGVKIIFESDLAPQALADFIAGYDAVCFGINYDIGNSASLGYTAHEEIARYGSRIDNVHVKDRLRGGTTVPLGEGAADLPGTLELLRASGYRGNYILQTARAAAGNHAEMLCRYRDMVRGWLAVEA